MRRKSILRFVTLILILGVIGICGQLLGVAQVKGSTTITFWTWHPDSVKLTKSIIKKFESLNPQIKVKLTHPVYTEHLTKLRVALSGRFPPDVFGIEVGHMVYEYGGAKLLEPLNSYFEKAFGSGWENRFFPIALKQVLDSDPFQEGTYYCVPVSIQNIQIYYNMDILDKYGIEAPFKSYDDLKKASDILNSKGIRPIAFGNKGGWQGIDWWLTLVSETAPGDFYRAQKGEVKWNSPGLVKALKIILDMQESRVFSPGAVGKSAYPEAYTEFWTGKAAMIMSGPWNLDAYKEMFSDAKWGIIPFPPLTEGGTPSKYPGGVDWGLSVPVVSKHKAEAVKFLEFMVSKEGQLAYWAGRGDLPAIKGITTLPDPANKYVNPYLKKDVEIFSKGMGNVIDRHLLYPALRRRAEIRSALINAIQGVQAKQLTPEQAMERVQQVYDKYNPR